MKNIHTILSEYGITIPEDKKAEFDKAVAENYKTSAEFEKKVNRLTDDLETEKKRADTAVETLKGFEGKDFDAITKERDEWKKKHEEFHPCQMPLPIDYTNKKALIKLQRTEAGPWHTAFHKGFS